MRPSIPSSTNELTLAVILGRLAARPEVEGLLTIGSTGAEVVTPASDYDLVVVLREAPVPLRVALTHIDHRLTDVMFVLVGEIESIAQPAALRQCQEITCSF